MTDPNVLVAAANADDAGVYRVADDLAVVLTADFFTPIVDDPYDFGAIAAANALSDVWAMGARPVIALNLAAFPPKAKFRHALREVMQGGIDKMAEAGVTIVGGHTIKDNEPKFGYAVMGLIHPDRIMDNTKARPGDAMLLTKPIGTGVISTGIKAGLCSPEVIAEVTALMAALNRNAGEAALAAGASTCTDITGFGLLGHMLEVLTASGLGARLRAAEVPVLQDARRLAAMGKAPGGTAVNLKSYGKYVDFAPDVTEVDRVLLNDAQTSGGLLIFVPAKKRAELEAELRERGVRAACIGQCIAAPDEGERTITVEP